MQSEKSADKSENKHINKYTQERITSKIKRNNIYLKLF